MTEASVNEESKDPDVRRGNVPIRRFENYLRTQIQEALIKQGLTREQCKIADICFAFNNRAMLIELRKRQKALLKAKFDKASEIEDKLTALKDEHYEKLIMPNQFYCTFQWGEAQQKALEVGKIKIGDKNVKIRETKSPEDIIWQNRGVKRAF